MEEVKRRDSPSVKNRVEFGDYGEKGIGVHSLALEKPTTYLILASYRAWNPLNPPGGIGLSLAITVGRGMGISFLALDKPTYQILAFYYA